MPSKSIIKIISLCDLIKVLQSVKAMHAAACDDLQVPSSVQTALELLSVRNRPDLNCVAEAESSHTGDSCSALS